MLATLRVPAIVAISCLAIAGCAGGSDLFGGSQVTTSSVAAPPAPKMDPACPSLSAQIDTLRKDGVAEKIEKAAAKKYKMTPADMAKADQLNKLNADFQAKCSTMPRAAAAPAVAPATAAAPAPAAAPAQKAAAAPAQETAAAAKQ